jgi:hypothetical protein
VSVRLDTEDLMRRLAGGVLVLAEVDGDLWASDRYWMAHLPENGVVQRLLATYNLDPDPGCFVVEHYSVRRENDRAAEMQALCDVALARDLKPVERWEPFGRPMCAEHMAAGVRMTEVWSDGERPLFLARRHLRTFALVCGRIVQWRWDGCSSNPAVAFAGDRNVGLVMPIKSAHGDDVALPKNHAEVPA